MRKRRILTDVDVIPPALPAVLKPVEMMDERVPTDEEADAALRSIGAEVTTESMQAVKTVGVWATKIKMPQVLMVRQFTSLDQIDRCKKLANTLIDAASGDSELGDVKDPEMAVNAIKCMTTALATEERMHGRLLELHEKSQPEKKPETGANKLAPVNHLHVHNVPQPA